MEYFKPSPSGNGEPPENKRNQLRGDGRGMREQNCRDWERRNELDRLLAVLITLPWRSGKATRRKWGLRNVKNGVLTEH